MVLIGVKSNGPSREQLFGPVSFRSVAHWIYFALDGVREGGNRTR